MNVRVCVCVCVQSCLPLSKLSISALFAPPSEENFNSKFGGGRQVGVMNVVKKAAGNMAGGMRVAGPSGPFGAPGVLGGTGGGRGGPEGNQQLRSTSVSQKPPLPRKPSQSEQKGRSLGGYEEDPSYAPSSTSYIAPQTGNFGLPPLDVEPRGEHRGEPSYRGEGGRPSSRRTSNASNCGSNGSNGSRPGTGTRGGSASFDHRGRRGVRENSPDTPQGNYTPTSFTSNGTSAY
jgi:hypothetical protein